MDRIHLRAVHGGPSSHGIDQPPKNPPDVGTKALIYRGGPNDLSHAEFGIKDGRVVWISLSYRE